jgi:DNA replication and repair protein RecF
MFYLKSIQLKNFRCYDDFQVSFSKNINIFVGNNAVGKTSLVEAVFCVGVGKSHKALSDQELVKTGSEYAFVKALFTNEDKNDEIIFSVLNNKKKISQNGNVFAKLSEYLGFINVIMFSADDLAIIKGTPADRREFLDGGISQINAKYLRALINYRKYLKQRNEFLKQIETNEPYDEVLLDTITEKLIKEAQVLIAERGKLVDNLNEKLKRINDTISDEKDDAKIVYFPNRLTSELEKAYEERKMIDIQLKTTTIGPHRDDFEAQINGNNAISYASSGQQRTLALSLKLGLAEIYQSKNERVIIILDDVFSELDANRQNKMMNFLDQKHQIFITTTSIDVLSSDIIKNSKIMKLVKEEADE